MIGDTGERGERGDDVTATIRRRWADLGPWHQRADTPWGSKVVHADYGEAFVGTSFHVTPPTDAWHESARQSARERRDLMCRVAGAVAHAPDDIAALLAEVDRLRADRAALFGGGPARAVSPRKDQP